MHLTRKEMISGARRNSEDELQDRRKNLRWLLIPVSAVLLALILNLFVFVNCFVPSGSMEDTVPEKSFALGFRHSYRSESPKRGDVVIFRHEGMVLLKRIVALPGETFQMKDGRAYVNGEILEESYITDFSHDSTDELTVPDGSYILLGDNRDHSTDSRKWDEPFVSEDDIIAKALFVYFPKFRSLR